MSKSEIHIVLVWQKGLNKLNHILHDLKNSFDVLDVVRINWDERFFSNNLSRFYGQNLPDRSFKEKHCGKGPFVGIIVRHNKPIYEIRKTSQGNFLVNALLFDKKQLYRNWTGGGHKVHASNDMKESMRDIFLLFSKKVEDYDSSDIWNENIRELDTNVQGFCGWKDFDEFFNFINNSSQYLILRNYKDIESVLRDSDSSDIDFLTSDRDFMYSVNGIKKHNNRSRAAYTIKVADNIYNIDIRVADDRYYDSKWACNMIKSKVLYKNKFFIPNPENEFYSLLYHALIHKKYLSEKYCYELLSISKVIGLKINASAFRDREKSFSILNNFLNDKGYQITRPEDYSVQYTYGYRGLKRFFWELIGKAKNV